MSIQTFLQLVALAAALCAQASEITFKNVTLITRPGGSTTIFESNDLSQYIPKTTALKSITIKGRIPVLYENSVSNIKNVDDIFFLVNRIEEIRPGAFKNVDDLKILTIIRSNLTVIKNGTFVDLPLEQMLLADNKIERIEPGAFANLPNLKNLYLDRNRIERIEAGTFVNLPNLQNFALGRNKIEIIEPGAFANLPILEILDLTANQIDENLQADAFDGLSFEKLDLSFNPFSTIPENFFDNLEVRQIYLQFTSITRIPSGVFTNNTHLKTVGLSWNEISTVESDAFDNMPNLEKVELTRTKLTKLDPKWFLNSPNINHLNFYFNKIEEIPNEAFKNIIKGNFTDINLSGNRINRISPGAFKGVRRIQRLNLSFNQIDKWNGSFLENVEQIHTLDLSYNDIKCPEGNLDDVFKANVTLLLNFGPLDDECKTKISEFNRMHYWREGRKVCPEYTLSIC